MVREHKNILSYLMVFLLGVLSLGTLQAAPAYEMQRICKNRAQQSYRLPREAIYTAVPRFLNGYYSIYGKSPQHTENALFFVCEFSRQGRFLRIKTEKDLRPSRAVKPTKAAKRSCKGEASSVWRIPRKAVRISNIQRVNTGRYLINVKAGGRKKARCDVNAQGHIYSFRAYKRDATVKSAKKACKRLASRLWKVPASTVQLDRVEKTRYDRYHLVVRYDRVYGKCDVNRNGRIHHFRTYRY
jgi:hypothetical protein